VVDRETARDALRAMLHGILFHRLFGTVKPTTLNCLDVTFPAVKDEEMDALVEDTVERFLRALQGLSVGPTTTSGNGGGAPKSPRLQPKKEGQLSLSFVEVRQKKATWFNSGGEVRLS
jgi:autophagy-related protein 101